MIVIRGRNYSSIHDDGIINAFGINVRWTDSFFNYMHPLLYHGVNHYNSFDDLLQRYLAPYRLNAPYPTLPMNAAFFAPGRGIVQLRMTGSRHDDEAALGAAPPNFTWHHIEGIWYENRHMYCRMVLINSAHHAQMHVGAVYEYKKIYVNSYAH